MITCSDMSSNFLSRPVDWHNLEDVYLGAQKNIGPAGLTINILRHVLLDHAPRNDVMENSSWSLASRSKNKFENTPCTWSIYDTGENMK